MRVNVSVTVDRPRTEVFDAMADARNEPAWNSQVSRTELVSGPPIGPGSRFTTVNRGQAYEAVIATYERPDRLTFDVSGKPMQITGAMTFTDEGAGTRLDGAFDFEPKGMMKLLLPLLGGAIRRDFPRQFASFKSFCEEGPEPATGTPDSL